MQTFLTALLESSFRGSIVILAVVLLRLLLKKAPKSLFCLLWLLAAVRLVLPFQIESTFSLQPRLETPGITLQAESTPQMPDILIPDPEGLSSVTPDVPTQDPIVPEGSWGELESESYLYHVEDGVITGPLTFYDVAGPVWILGLGAMLLVSFLSYLRLKRRVAESCRCSDGCWECPGLETAFVLGFVSPRIYLPTGLSVRDRKFIYDHENTHIARHDHISKLLGYLVLSIHWFNPLVWLGYHLLCRDIELACDEHVVKYMDLQERKAYSNALLTCGTHTSRFAACPVAFGESSPRQRILNVLRYKKPTVWIMGLALLAVIFVSLCLLTSPKDKVTAETSPGTTVPATEPPVTESAPTEELQQTPQNAEALIRQCREAMEALKSGSELYLRIINLNNPDDVTNTYMRAENGWLFQYQRPVWDYQPVSLLYYEEEHYTFIGERDENGVLNPPYYWRTETSPESTGLILPYPFDLDWTQIGLDFLGCTQANGQTTVTVSFPLYLDLFSFVFDEQGQLLWFDISDSSGEPEATTNRVYTQHSWRGNVRSELEMMYRQASQSADRMPEAMNSQEYQALFGQTVSADNESQWVDALYDAFYTDPEEFVAQLAVLEQADPDRVGYILSGMSDWMAVHARGLFSYTVSQIPEDHHPYTLQRLKLLCPGLSRQEQPAEPYDPNTQLAKCADALREFKSVNYWCLVENNFFSGGDVLNTSSDSTWYICGSDYLCHTRISETGGCDDFWSLCKDSTYHHRLGFTSDGPEFGSSWESEWNTGVYDGTDLQKPWPLWFNWATADLNYMDTVQDEYFETISFWTLGDPTGQNGGVQKYTVTFQLDSSGTLKSIRLNYLLGTTEVEKVIVPRTVTKAEVTGVLEQHHMEVILQIGQEEHHNDHHDDDHH